MEKDTDAIESQLIALLVAQVQAEHERLITDLTDAAAQAALDRLVRQVAAEERRIHRGRMGAW